MPRVGPYDDYDDDDMMTERRSMHSRSGTHQNNNQYDYHNFNGEAVDVDDAIAGGGGSRTATARSRTTTAGTRNGSTRTKPSRVSLSENGSLSIDYGVVSPIPPGLPPGLPPPPFPVFPGVAPVTYFGRNATAYSELDTLKLAPDVGSRSYWQAKGAGTPIRNGSPLHNGTLSETTSTSGVVSGEDSSSMSGLVPILSNSVPAETFFGQKILPQNFLAHLAKPVFPWVEDMVQPEYTTIN
jgi:hypothetical protein